MGLHDQRFFGRVAAWLEQHMVRHANLAQIVHRCGFHDQVDVMPGQLIRVVTSRCQRVSQRLDIEFAALDVLAGFIVPVARQVGQRGDYFLAAALQHIQTQLVVFVQHDLQLFGLLAFAEVLDDAPEVLLTVAAGNQHTIECHRNKATILAQVFLFIRAKTPVFFQKLALCHLLLGESWWRQAAFVQVHQLQRAIAADVAEGGVEFDKAALQIRHGDTQRREFVQAAQFLISFAQCRLSQLRCADIGHHGVQAAHFAAIDVGQVLNQNIARLMTLGCGKPAFELLHLAAQRRFEVGQVQAVGFLADDIAYMHAWQTIRLDAGPVSIGQVTKAVAQLAIPIAHHGRDVVDDGVQVLIALVKALFGADQLTQNGCSTSRQQVLQVVHFGVQASVLRPKLAQGLFG